MASLMASFVPSHEGVSFSGSVGAYGFSAPGKAQIPAASSKVLPLDLWNVSRGFTGISTKNASSLQGHIYLGGAWCAGCLGGWLRRGMHSGGSTCARCVG